MSKALAIFGVIFFGYLAVIFLSVAIDIWKAGPAGIRDARRRRHHNNKGLKQVRDGKTWNQVRAMAKRLGIPAKPAKDQPNDR